MSLPFNLAKRYFFSRKSGGSFNLITTISGISLLGYMVGAAALLIVLSVFNGFEFLFIGMYNKFDADIRITAAKGKVFDVKTANIPTLQNIDGVWKISEVLEENVLLKYGERQNLATIKGVDKNYSDIAGLDSSIVAGFGLLEEGDTNFAIVGQGIAYQLSVNPNDIFYNLHIYIPKRGVTDVMDPENSFAHAVIAPVGVFSVQEEVDNKYVIVPLRFLRPLLDRPSEVTSLDIRVKQGFDMDDVKEKLVAQLGDNFIVQNRFEQREAFFKIMKSEKAVSYLILLFILFIAASNTIGSLYILVMEKKRDLQILSSLGLTKEQAATIFKYEGLFIAFVGGVIGLGLGIVICLVQEKFGIVKIEGAESFTMEYYPVKLKMMDVFLVFVTVIFLGWITSIYPAKKAKELFLR
jgi:lipoprotein-releasing system permease protein